MDKWGNFLTIEMELANWNELCMYSIIPLYDSLVSSPSLHKPVLLILQGGKMQETGKHKQPS